MCGNSNKHGFSLLEILIVLTIIGFLGAIVVPNLQGRNPAAERKQFVARLNELLSFAWYNAITTGKVQRIFFNFEAHQVQVEQQKLSLLKPSQDPVYELVSRAYTQTTLNWPKNLQVKNFFIEGYDEVARHGSGRQMKNTWFFLVPDGLAQDVTINMVDMNDRTGANKAKHIHLVLNPFSVQCTEYNGFKQVT